MSGDFGTQWHSRSRSIFGGATSNPLHAYRDRPQAFFREQLKTPHITAQMSQLLDAMLTHQIVVVKSATGTGKSYTLAGASIWLYKTWPRVGVYTAAASPIDNLKLILWGEIGTFVAANPDLFKPDKVNDLHIGRAKKEYITGLTIPSRGREADMIAAFSGKHHPDCIAGFFDEGDGIPDPCYIGFDGCLSGGGKQLLVVAFNPKKREGWVYNQILQGRAHVVTMDAYSHTNVITGKIVVPGAVDRPATVRRINEWAEPLLSTDEPDENCFLLPEFLVGEVGFSRSGKEYKPLRSGYYHVNDDQYWYKVAGEFPPMGMGRLISEVKLDEAVARWRRYMDLNGGPPDDVLPDMGFDVADTDDDNALCFRYGSFVDEFIVWSGFDVPYSAKRASEQYHKRNCRQAFVDSIGVGAAVPPLMAGDGKCKRVISAKVNEEAPGITVDGEFDSMRDYAYLQVANFINNDPTAMIPPSERLLAGLRTLKRMPAPNDRIRVTSKKEMKSVLGFSPDEMESLMLTFFPKSIDTGPLRTNSGAVTREEVGQEMRLRRLMMGLRD